MRQTDRDIPAAEDDTSFETQCREVMQLTLTDVDAAIVRGGELVSRAGSSPARRMWALVALAHAQTYAGEFATAIELLEEARGLTNGEPTREAMVANVLVQPLMRIGRTADACIAAEQSAQAARVAGDDLAVAKALMGLGAARRAAGDPAAAVDALSQAEQLAGDEAAIRAAVQSNRAECLLDLDRFDEALASFEQAAAGFAELGIAHAEAIVHGNIADLLGRLGRVDEAMAAFERARRVFESNGASLDAARLSCEEAEMLAHAGALRAARDRYATAIPLLEQAAAGADLARARVALGGVLVDLGDPSGAREQFRAAEEELSSMPALLGTEIRLGLARCALANGNARRAAQEAGEAADGFCDLGIRQARALLVRAEAMLAEGAPELAIESATQARALASTALTPVCDAIVAACLRSRGRDDDAVSTLAAACAQAEAVLASTRSGAARAGLARRYVPIFTALASLRLDKGEPGATESVLLASALGRLQSTAQPPALASADSTIHDQLERVTETIARRSIAAGVQPAHKNTDELGVLQAEARVLRERLGCDEASGVLERLSPAEVQGALEPDAVVLHYFRERDALSALMLGRDVAHIQRSIATTTGVVSAARRLAFIAERTASTEQPLDSTDDAWASVAGDLASRLLAPLGRRTGCQPLRRIVITGEPMLQCMPWAGLVRAHWCDSSEEAPGVTCGGAIPSIAGDRARPDEPRVVVLGAKDSSLPCVPEELAAVSAPWGSAATQLGGTCASAMAQIHNADVLHIATHGVFVPDRPLASRLWIGDRWAQVTELAEVLRPGAVVTLSACHAARSGGLAEDIAAIPEALRAAGASEVIAPIWPIADRRAVSVFSALHERMAALWPARRAVTDAVRVALTEADETNELSLDLMGVVSYGGVAC